MPRPLVIGNWKMNGTRRSVAELLDGILQRWQGERQAEVAVCAPFVHLPLLHQQLADSSIRFGAQDVSHCENGAHTGDISAEMLKDMGCHYVIVGHSERRQNHSESSELVARKFAAAAKAQLVPILCVGETLEEREADRTLEVIREQLDAVAALVGVESVSRAVVAYEPVWAIGTGRTATPEQAQEVHAFIRDQLGAGGKATPLLYGGSVKAANAEALFRQPDIDGGLIGGASLDAEEFAGICKAGEQRASRLAQKDQRPGS